MSNLIETLRKLTWAGKSEWTHKVDSIYLSKSEMKSETAFNPISSYIDINTIP